jgi:hypothetical protein
LEARDLPAALLPWQTWTDAYTDDAGVYHAPTVTVYNGGPGTVDVSGGNGWASVGPWLGGSSDDPPPTSSYNFGVSVLGSASWSGDASNLTISATANIGSVTTSGNVFSVLAGGDVGSVTAGGDIGEAVGYVVWLNGYFSIQVTATGGVSAGGMITGPITAQGSISQVLPGYGFPNSVQAGQDIGYIATGLSADGSSYVGISGTVLGMRCT